MEEFKVETAVERTCERYKLLQHLDDQTSFFTIYNTSLSVVKEKQVSVD